MLNTIDKKDFIEISEELSRNEINNVGWDGGAFNHYVENITSKLINFSLNHTELLYNNVSVQSSSDKLKIFSGNSNGSTAGDFDDFDYGGNQTKYEPQIPEYIRTTSMVFCVVIMCLGVIGNIMVSKDQIPCNFAFLFQAPKMFSQLCVIKFK